MEKPQGLNTCRTCSSRMVADSEDVMVNILSRLTVKALSRFKCVSKQWNRLISDPCFVSSHQVRATQDPNVLQVLWVDQRDGSIGICSIMEKEERMISVDCIRPSYPHKFLHGGPILLEGRPCNGLICLLAGGHDSDTMVCNPATGYSMVIRRGKKRKYTYVQGLGYCSSSNELKVLRLCERLNHDKSIPKNDKWYGCELFTVNQRGIQQEANLPQQSRSWRYVGDLPYEIVSPALLRMCYVNGRAHWIIDYSNSTPSEFILSLDLELEKFSVVASPEAWSEEDFLDYLPSMRLMELGGKLCVGVRIHHRKVLEIWVLNDYTNSIWSKDYQIDLEAINLSPSLSRFPVVALWRGQLLVVSQLRKMLFYDHQTNSSEEIIPLEPFHGYGGVCRFVENLIKPF